MISLIFFVVLWSMFARTVWTLRQQLALLPNVGIGGINEDLDAARKIILSCAIRACILAVLGLVILLVAARWAHVWRTTTVGTAVLTGLNLIAAICAVWTIVYLIRQEWSAKGSHRGMAIGMLGSLFSFGFVALTIHWRWG